MHFNINARYQISISLRLSPKSQTFDNNINLKYGSI